LAKFTSYLEKHKITILPFGLADFRSEQEMLQEQRKMIKTIKTFKNVLKSLTRYKNKKFNKYYDDV